MHTEGYTWVMTLYRSSRSFPPSAGSRGCSFLRFAATKWPSSRPISKAGWYSDSILPMLSWATRRAMPGGNSSRAWTWSEAHPIARSSRGSRQESYSSFFGLGLLRLHAWNIGDEGPLVFGTLALALGLGFGVAADVANDLLRETYCRFLTSGKVELTEAKPYLFRIATNLLHDRWRKGEDTRWSELLEIGFERDLDCSSRRSVDPQQAHSSQKKAELTPEDWVRNSSVPGGGQH
jgi:hypothetical protein